MSASDVNPEEEWGPCGCLCAEGKPCRGCGMACKGLCFAFGCHCCCAELGDRKYLVNVNKKDRHCTDVPCCLFMILCLVIQFIVFITAATGDAQPKRLTHLSDYKGRVCHEDYADGKYAAWPDIRMYEIRICIDSCKNTNTDGRMVTPPWDTDTNKDYSEAEAETIYGYRSKKFLHTMCLPDPNSSDVFVSADLKDDYQKWEGKADNLAEVMDRGIGDLWLAWPILMGSCFGALIFSLLYVKALQLVAEWLVWISIVAVFVCLVLIGTFLINNSERAYDYGYTQLGDIMYYVGVFLIILDVMYVFAVCFMVKRIRLATAVAKEATRAMRDAWQLVFLPLIPFLSILAYGCYWIVALLNMASVTKESNRKWPNGIDNAYFTNGKTLRESLKINDTDKYYRRHSITDNYKVAVMFHIFMIFWVVAAIGYASYMAITGVYAEWYFSDWADESEERKRVGHEVTEFSPTAVYDWAGRVVRYHLGTIAVASFAIAVVEYIDFMLTYFEKKLVGSDPTPAQKAMLACIHCFLKCMKCIMDRINRNGITITAIYGWPFCPASMKGLELVFKNVVRAAALDMVSGYLVGIGQLTIIALNCMVTIVVARHVYGDELSSILFVVLMAAFISWNVARPFLDLFEVAVSTIFICFLIDEERNKGGHMRASARLKKIINEDVKPSGEEVRSKAETKRNKGFEDSEDDAQLDAEKNTDTEALVSSSATER